MLPDLGLCTAVVGREPTERVLVAGQNIMFMAIAVALAVMAVIVFARGSRIWSWPISTGALPVAKRFAPVLAGLVAGLIVGALLGHRRRIVVVMAPVPGQALPRAAML